MYISSKSKTRENVGPLLNRAADVVTQKRLRNFNAFSVLVITSKMCLEESEASQTTGKL